jgi:ABC-type transport system involved in Fe-S cluster assembly fused permease/ATPase subunit
MIFIFGFFLGVLTVLILFLVSYIFVSQLISRWGIQIKERALNSLAKLEEKTISAKFVFPDFEKEKFQKSEVVDDLLQ